MGRDAIRGGSDWAPAPPEPEVIALILYTSGTTGEPKGVPLTHANIVCTIAGMMHHARGTGFVEKPQVHLSYLPLAHILENVMQFACVLTGSAIGFYCGNVRLLTDDAKTLRPTVFMGVPRVWQRVANAIRTQFAGLKGAKAALIARAVHQQTLALRAGRRVKIWDKIVFSKVRNVLGGRVALMMSGAAPLPAYVLEFIRVCFGVPFLEGFGMTETSGIISTSAVHDALVGHVGAPFPTCAVMLRDVPELGYSTQDDPPMGEVCVRGPNVFAGYFKNPAATAESLSPDGWLFTGDIGRWNPNGTLSIVDRKKDIFKNALGEYICVEMLEAVYRRSLFVAQIFVHGDPFHSALVAVVVPDVVALGAHARLQPGWAQSLPELCASPEVHALLVSELRKAAAAVKLKPFELVKAFHLEGEVNDLGQGFNVQNECLTPTFKMKRPQLRKRYAAEIKAMYAAVDQVVGGGAPAGAVAKATTRRASAATALGSEAKSAQPPSEPGPSSPAGSHHTPSHGSPPGSETREPSARGRFDLGGGSFRVVRTTQQLQYRTSVMALTDSTKALTS
jgi:long-chain acyl-CoA synthetase